MEAILQRVTKDPLGAALAAAVVEGDQVLVLDDAMDFPEDGGRLTLAGQTYTFTAVDTDTETVTLADSVLAAADAGEPVGLLTALGEDASVWTAWVFLDDSPEPVPAHIPSRLVSFYVEGQEQAGATITLRPRDGRYEVETRPGSYAGESNLQVLAGGLTRLSGGGGIMLDNGVSAPGTRPQVSEAWDDDVSVQLQYFSGNPEDGTYLYGLHWDGSVWATGRVITSGTSSIHTKNPDGTWFTGANMPAGFRPNGGLVHLGSWWYVLGLVGTDYYVYRFDDTLWTRDAGYAQLLASSGSIGGPSLATDGTDLFMAYRIKSSNTLRLLQRTTAGVNVNIYDSPAGAWTTSVLGLYVGTADFGAPRAIMASPGTVYAWSYSGSTLTRQVAHGWSGANGEEIRGLAWDGSNFWTLSGDTAKVWKYANTTVSATRSIRSTLYDNDPGGTGTHETNASPARSYTQKARHWMRVSVAAPQNYGAADDPNAVRIYIDDQLQPDLATGQTSVVYGAPATGGAAPPTSNGFVGVSSPGFIISGATDADGPIIALYGDGSGRVGPWRWDSTGAAI